MEKKVFYSSAACIAPTVIIPKSVKKIDYDAFCLKDDLEGAADVYCYATTPPDLGEVSSSAPFKFFSVSKVGTGLKYTYRRLSSEYATLHVPKGCENDYLNSSWGRFFDSRRICGDLE